MTRHNSYADEISTAKVMLAGLKANREKLAKRGISAEYLSSFEELYTKSMNLDNEQEALKSRLKEKTTALEETMQAMEKMFGEAKKLIKIEMPKESWKEFGMADQR